MSDRLSLKHSKWIEWVFFLLIFILYVVAISPYAQSDDSGEMATAAFRLSVPHPPGYPLYVYLAHVFTWIPWGSVAWQVGLFSAACQMGANILLFRLARALLGNSLVALAVTAFYALAPEIWMFASQAEVFALNNLLILLALTALKSYADQVSLRKGLLVVFLSGIAISHHQTSTLILFPMVLFFIIRDWRMWLKPVNFLSGILSFSVGLTPFLLLFPLGRHLDIASWGDFSDWHGWWMHVSRAEYGSLKLTTSYLNGSIWNSLWWYLKEWVREGALWPVITFILALGIFAYKRRFDFLAMLALTSIIYVVCINIMSEVDPSNMFYHYIMMRMWMPSMIPMWLVAGFGLNELRIWLKLRPTLILLPLSFVLVGTTLYNWKYVRRTNGDFGERLVETIFNGVEPGAIVFTRGDSFIGISRYVRYARNFRPDTYMVAFDLLGHSWSRGLFEKMIPGIRYPQELPDYDPKSMVTFREMVLANLDKFPIYLPQLTGPEEQISRNGLQGFIYGFGTRISTANKVWTLDEVKRETKAFLALQVPDIESYPWDAWERFIAGFIEDYKLAIGASVAARSEGRKDWVDEADRIFRLVAAEAEPLHSKAIMQVAYMYDELTEKDSRYKAQAISTWQEYLNTKITDLALKAEAERHLKRWLEQK